MIGVYALGLAALVLVPLSPVVRMLIGGAIVFAFVAAWRQHLLRRGRRAIRTAVWTADGAWELTDGSGRERTAALTPDCLALPACVILHLRLAEGGRRSLILLPDALDADTLRRLRVRLRLEGARADAHGLR